MKFKVDFIGIREETCSADAIVLDIFQNMKIGILLESMMVELKFLLKNWWPI